MNSFEDVMDTRDETIQQLKSRIQHRDNVITTLKEELENIKMIASVSENTKQEAVNDLKRRHQEEIESLRKALEESFKNSEAELREQFDRERSQKFESNIEEHEISMEQAHSEAEKLKSVVLPLEEEIKKLKEDLLNKSKQLEALSNVPLTGNNLLHKLNQENSTIDSINHSIKTSEVNEECDGANDCLILQEKLSKVIKQLEKEQSEHAVLKEKWSAANDQFLESHRLLCRDVGIMESVLLEDQKQQVKLLKLRAQAKEAQANSQMAKSPNSSFLLLRQKTEEFKETVAKSGTLATPEDDSDSQSFGSFQDFQIISDDTRSDKPTVQVKVTQENQNDEEVEKRKELEESIMRASDDAMKQILELAKKLKDYESLSKEIQTRHNELNKLNTDKLISLTKDRNRIREEMSLLISEKNRLKTLQEEHQNKLSKEAYVMPKTPEAVRVQIDMYREALVKSKAEREAVESKLQSRVSFLQNRLQSEENSKNQLEKSLGDELHENRTRINSLQKQLVQSNTERDQLKCSHENHQMSIEAIRVRSKEIIKDLQVKLAKETKLKNTLEKELFESKNQLHSLQESLQTSEQVQRDFVRLSQSLQVELEQIRTKQEEEERLKNKKYSSNSDNVSPQSSITADTDNNTMVNDET